MKKKFEYWFDSIMARGTMPMIGLLLGAILIVACVVGVLSAPLTGEPIHEQIWVSLMHSIDTGTLTADDPDNVLLIVLMTIATVCGIFFTSALIGIIAVAFQKRLDKLKRGTSTVLEKGHTVIFGYNDGLFVLLESLIEANAHRSKQCVVVVGDADIFEMEEAVRSRIPNFKNTKVVFRSGELFRENTFALVGVENAHNVIVNSGNDALNIKILLVLTSYLDGKGQQVPDPNVATTIRDGKFVRAAKLAGGERTQVVFTDNAVSHAVAHAFNHSGVCRTLMGMFNCRGYAFFYKSFPQAEGKKFGDVLHLFDGQMVFGIFNNDGCQLDPPMDTVIQAGDQLIMLGDRDCARVSSEPFSVDEAAIADGEYEWEENSGLLVLGQSLKLVAILKEYDKCTQPGTRVTIADLAEDLKYDFCGYENLTIDHICVKEFNAATIRSLLSRPCNNVLILASEEKSAQAADSETLTRLLEIRAVREEMGQRLSVMSEIRSSDNYKFADLVGADDFAGSDDTASMLLAQLSSNKDLVPLFKELLGPEGPEMRMKPVPLYVDTQLPVDFHTVIEAAARRGEVAVGFKRESLAPGEAKVVLNPNKREKIAFAEHDLIAVISND